MNTQKKSSSRAGQATLLSLWSDGGDGNDGGEFEKKKSKLPRSLTQPGGFEHSKKKKKQWISSSFDDFGDFGEDVSASQPSSLSASIQSSRKRQRGGESADKPSFKGRSRGNPDKKEIETEIWADIHKPKTQSDLAVHKKKISEVETWLQQHCAKIQSTKKKCGILLLTGPAGAGKTATVEVLCQELGIEIQEWINPLMPAYEAGKSHWRKDFIPIGGFTSESQQTLFHDFLFRANRYKTLQIFENSAGLSKKIILVEDMPNVFFRDPYSFHDILRRYSVTGRCPLLFILSDSFGGESTLRDLFPKDVQLSVGIDNISFNPVAPTSMTKVLTRIAQNEASQGHANFTMPSIDEVTSAASGDIRGAINALQFTCLQDPSVAAYFKSLKKTSFTKKESSGKLQRRTAKGKEKGKSKDERRSGELDNAPAIGGRDHAMFLFRALGKILHSKRDLRDENCPSLPAHLSMHERDPINFNPEEVIDKTHLSSEYFTSYLHQNYIDFYTDVDDIVNASAYLSDADYLTLDWTSRSALREYSSSVAARGIIHCNSARSQSGSVGGRGWKPLHKPQLFEVNRKYREGVLTARHLFSGHCWTPEDLQTQLMPYLALINIPLSSPGQISFLQEVCKFSNSRYAARTERLDEKDVDTLKDNEDESVSAANSKILVEDESSQTDLNVAASQSSDEEIIIEDFDD